MVTSDSVNMNTDFLLESYVVYIPFLSVSLVPSGYQWHRLVYQTKIPRNKHSDVEKGKHSNSFIGKLKFNVCSPSINRMYYDMLVRSCKFVIYFW